MIRKNGKAFYFDKYSRKIYYDDEAKGEETSNKVVVVDKKNVQRRGTIAYKFGGMGIWFKHLNSHPIERRLKLQ